MTHEKESHKVSTIFTARRVSHMWLTFSPCEKMTPEIFVTFKVYMVHSLKLLSCFILHYYSFKIFPRFWLAKSTCIIHHNQLLMTKFGRILCLTRKWCQKCSLLQVELFWLWKQKWLTLHSFQEYELQLELGEVIAKNIAKTAKRQFGGRHLLFGEYLQSWTNLNVHYRRWT